MNTIPPPSPDREFMKLAIELSKNSKVEDERTHPHVGVVVVKDNEVIAKGFRGEIKPGEHAEYTVLERKLEHESIAGAVVYTTLEPCTLRRHPKVPCADRIVERKVGKVVIGILDPNPEIAGKGQQRLRDANIETILFPADLMAEIEEINREFIRSHRRQAKPRQVSGDFIIRNHARPLDHWYNSVNTIYWNRNFSRDAAALFTHLVEVTGGLSLLASQKRKFGLIPENFLPKALAWWMAVCGKVGVKSISEMLWAKFPAVCPYCHRNPHDPDECTEMKNSAPGIDWERLQELGRQNNDRMPKSLGAWQRMFSQIFPAQQTEEFGSSFGRLGEELGELAESIRVFPAQPGYFLSEASDVFAWLMHIQNIVDQKADTPKASRGENIEKLFCAAYPDKCTDCDNAVCSCPPILDTTIGRIAHEAPPGRGGFGENGFFMTPEQARLKFQFGRALH